MLVSALLNLMSMYHDTLLAKIVQSEAKYRPLIPSSLHTRFTRAWSDKNIRYKWAARLLELIRFTELVIEMGLRRKASAQNRWRGIVLLEAVKFAWTFISKSELLFIRSSLQGCSSSSSAANHAKAFTVTSSSWARLRPKLSTTLIECVISYTCAILSIFVASCNTRTSQK